MYGFCRVSKISTLGGGVAALLSVSALCPATEGYFSHGWGTASKGMAGASIAYASDSLSGALNPASISYVGRRADVGLSVFMPSRYFDATSASGGTFPLAPGRVDSRHDAFLVPSLGVNWAMKDGKGSVALLIYGNGGMNTEYKSPVFGSGNTGVNLEQLFVSPTVSRMVSDKTSVGLSLIYCSQKFRAEGLANFAGMSIDSTKLTNHGDDTSTGFGFKIGGLHKVSDKLSIGAAYQPKINMDRFTKYSGLFAEQGDFDIPENYTVGLAYKPDDRRVWTADVRTIKYSGVRAVSNSFASGGPLGADNGPGFGWRDMTVIKVGHEVKANDQWTWRFGASHGREPIPSSEALFNILAPGVQEWQFTVGCTRQLKEGALNLAVMYSPSVSVEGMNPLAPTQKIKLNMHQLDIEVGYTLRF